MNHNSSFLSPELLYAAIVDSSDDVIISKDLEGTIKSWNRAAERIFGYSADEIVGHSVAKLLPPDRPEEEAQILARLQKGERVDHFETQRKRKDGQLVDVSLTISPIRDAEGVIVGASKIARDITQQKKAARQLAETYEELKRAERMKMEFVATLSHELRTPLNAILGWVQILNDPNSSTEDLATGLPVIERNVRAQSQLIEDLLDMSRIEAGKISLDVQQVDLAEVVNAGLETVRPAATANKIRLSSTFADVRGIVMGDKSRLQRILHGENGELVDRTDLSSIDFAKHTVCAAVDSLSPFVVALAPTLPNRLQNISTRLRVETGDGVLIGGFIVLGTETKTVIVRAIGPSLTDFGVPGALADPVLELHGGDGSLLTSNDNWKTTQKTAIMASGLAPTKDKESAIIADLEPGNYTLVVRGKNGGTGVGLVEAYDLAAAADSEFANISTRGKVGTGTDVMIGGFILGGGTDDNTVLVRALGPSLSDAGVSGALADPTLELRDQDGNLVRSNDNWKDDQMAAILATGLSPTKNLESAILQTLAPGNYTAIVAGKDGGIGVGLVEAYRLQ